MAPNDFRRVLQTTSQVLPDEVFNLAGQSSVGLSLKQRVAAIESIALAQKQLRWKATMDVDRVVAEMYRAARG